MILLIIWSTWLATMLAFFVGFRIGNLKEGEKLPEINPIKTIKKSKENKKALEEIQKEQEKFETIAQNIENYDGTPFGQKDIPE